MNVKELRKSVDLLNSHLENFSKSFIIAIDINTANIYDIIR